MDGSPRPLSACVPVEQPSQFFLNIQDDEPGRLQALIDPYLERVRQVIRRFVPTEFRIDLKAYQTLLLHYVSTRGLTAWQASYPVIHAHSQKYLPFLALPKPVEEPEQPDPVQVILQEFQDLGPEQQRKVARNLALLWQSFTETFGGISNFLSSPPFAQDSYLEKLEAAARRMEAARGSEATFHYVTVELMRLYITFFRTGSRDQNAVALARLVAPLIDRGHAMAEPAAVQ